MIYLFGPPSQKLVIASYAPSQYNIHSTYNLHAYLVPTPREFTTGMEQECSPDYITTTNIYNQKVAAAGEDQLAKLAYPSFLSPSCFSTE